METQSLEPRPWRLRLPLAFRILRDGLLLIFMPIYLVLLILALPAIGCVVLGMLGWSYRQARLLDKRLRATLSPARSSSWAQLEAHPSDQPMTVIIENRSVGWNWVHLWWSPEDYHIHNGPPALTDEQADRTDRLEEISAHPFLAWCEAMYTHPVSGHGKLVDCLHSARASKRLERRLEELARLRPNLQRVHFWSGALAEGRAHRSASKTQSQLPESTT